MRPLLVRTNPITGARALAVLVSIALFARGLSHGDRGTSAGRPPRCRKGTADRRNRT
jgi:hypothetical protein